MAAARQIDAFFEAWGMTEPAAQAEVIHTCFNQDSTYSDPRSDGVLTGPRAIAEYVSAFAANAPGWTAKVVAASNTGDWHRATVAFGGMGPDGSEMVQHGQYFVHIADDKITQMVGFVGTGAPE